MASKTIVNGSMGLADESQQVVRCARVEYGPNADTAKGVVFTTTGVKTLFTLPANAVLFDAKHRVLTAFSSSVTITIGDTSQAAGLFASADIAPQSAVTTGILKANAVSAYFNATGKLGGYAVPSARNINATVAAAAPAAGKAELFIVYACNAAD